MKDIIVSLINNEDKKNPLTDKQIAFKLNTSREKVNMLRIQEGIPSYTKRREKIILKAISDIIAKNYNISLRKLTILLKQNGFEISTYGLQKYKDFINNEKNKYINSKEIYEKQIINNINDKKKKTTAFINLIGNEGSLRPVVKLAKAAVLYPQNGLHTLVVGNTGVGKSYLVEEMHEFAKNSRANKQVPFVVFNCADYSDNPQLLVSQLFGHAKGSFTGAFNDKKGLVEKADGGMLFLDEIHRLPPKGQEILFRIIDKGEFSRIGETDRTRKVKIMIIGATTESIESSLLVTFRRRIPVLIEVPVLEERPVSERLMLIRKFLSKEASRMNLEIKMSRDVLETLLLYKCTGNIGQLKSDIQVICAKAFVNHLSSNSNHINITTKDLPDSMKQEMLNILKRNKDENILNLFDLNVLPNQNDEVNKNLFKHNLYEIIEKKSRKKSNYVNTDDGYLNEILYDSIKEYSVEIVEKYSMFSINEISKLLDRDIVNILDNIKDMIFSYSKIEDISLIKVLSFHIDSALKRIENSGDVLEIDVDYIKNKYGDTFFLSQKLINMIEEKLELNFPQDEVIYITLFIDYFIKKRNSAQNKNVGIIVMTHGDAAVHMLTTAQTMVGTNHGDSLNIALDEEPQYTLMKTRKLVKKANEGKGVLLLVDMGYLSKIGEIIAENDNIEVKTIKRVDTMMILDALAQSVYGNTDLQEMYEYLIKMSKIDDNTMSWH